jgi:hypothetical protein
MPGSSGIAKMVQEPVAGSIGKVDIQIVCLLFQPGTKIDYKGFAYSESTSPRPSVVVIDISDPDSIGRLTSAMNKRRIIKFTIGGSDAVKIFESGADELFESLNQPNVTNQITSNAFVADDVAVIALLVALGLGVVALTCTTIIAIKAVEKNYTVDIDFSMVQNGPISTPTLTWNLTPK